MIYEVIILPRAEEDIFRNAQWWAEHHSSAQAAKWIDAIYHQLTSLAQDPLRHPLSAENELFANEIREKLIGLGNRPGYRAVFTVQANRVYVLTIRRGAEGTLGEEEEFEVPLA